MVRRRHERVECICPQFTCRHINFQRVPVVDRSDPFIARTIPTVGERLVVIRFANPKGIDRPCGLGMPRGSCMSRARKPLAA